MKKANRRHKKQDTRSGTAALEFALIAPVMILFTFGMVELGHVIMMKNAATQACREGARLAVTPTATTEAVRAAVTEELDIYDISEPIITINPVTLGSAQPGQTVTVSVEVNLESNSWIPGLVSPIVTSVSAETKMRREST